MSSPFDQWMPEPPTDYQRGHALQIEEEAGRLALLPSTHAAVVAHELAQHNGVEAALMVLEIIQDWYGPAQRQNLRQALIRRIP